MTTLLALLVTLAAAAPLTEKETLDGADARIEQHRKGDAMLVIVGTDGQPLADGAEIKIEQTRNR